MENSFIPFAQSGQFSKLILDYINEDAFLQQFYRHKPVVGSYKNIIAQKNYDDALRPLLVETLEKQYLQSAIDLKKHKAVANNISNLLQPGTFTVTTGHQLCLFTGPLYFIYKILTTIKWCEELKKTYPQHHFVPVFWMASEDHDFEEVNHVFINKDKISWDIDSQQQPVGRLPLKDFDNVAREVLGKAENDFARQQLQTFLDFYTTSPNLAVATRKLVHHLFADKGLVILDADEKALKQAFIPFIKRDILEQSNFNVLQQTNTELRNRYKTQVNGREINFFYMDDSGRRLIKQHAKGFVVDGTDTVFTPGEIEQQIEQAPERFSPNVIMRPLYQEVILPNLSYIGGPGEIAYWLQLKGVFEHNRVAFPALTLRNFIMLVKEQHANQLAKMGLNVDDFFDEEIKLERKLVELNNDGGQKKFVTGLDDYLQELVNIAEKTDNRISSELIRYKTTWRKELLRLSANLDKQQRQKVSDKIKKTLKFKEIYFKNGTMQERFDNVLSYGVSQSVPQLIDFIYRHAGPVSRGIRKLIIAG